MSTQTIVLHENKKHAPRIADGIVDFLETGDGVYYSTQWLDRVLSLWNAVRPHASLAAAANVYGGCWRITALPHLPFVWKEAKTAIAEAQTHGLTHRRLGNAARTVTAAVAWTGYAFTGVSSIFKATASATFPVAQAADTVMFVSDSIDLRQQSENFGHARSLAKRACSLKAAPALRQEYAKTKNYYMLKVMETACSVAGFVLGLGLMAAGAATLPGLVILAASVSLLSTTFSCSANLYKRTMRHQPIDFFSDKHVAPCHG